MTIESIFSSLFILVNGILYIQIPVGQYTITMWQVMIYGFIVYQVLKFFFSIVGKE